jgi:hypothetical protein
VAREDEAVSPREFSKDTIKSVFSEEVVGVVYPHTALLLKSRKLDAKVVPGPTSTTPSSVSREVHTA